MSDLTLAGLVRRHAAERPDHPCLVCGDETITYGQLGRRTDQVAAALVAAGVGPGDRVALLGRNGPLCLDVMFGAAKCGAVYVPVSWRLAPPEVAAVVEDARPAVLVVGADFLPGLARVADRLAAATTVVVAGGGPLAGGGLPYADWIAGHAPADPGGGTGPGDVALLMYTSGTTGAPKGAMLTNAGLLGRSGDLARLWRYDADGVHLVALPLFHIGGTAILLLGLSEGCTTVLLADVDPALILKLVTSERVTNALLVPAIIASLLDTPGCEDVDWSSLRSLIYGAAPISATLLRRAMDTMRCDFNQIYGMTEHSGAVSWLSPGDHDPAGRPGLLRSCGRPLPWVEVAVADPESGAPLPAGVTGEIWARSGHVMAGYRAQPEATAAALTADGWLRTGDAGYLDAEGYLFIQDRIKDMIVSGGENVYPAEVENVLMRHPAVADVAVIGVPHDRWGETPKAVVVPKPGAAVAAAELIAFCRDELAGFKCPTSVDVVAALPRNAGGKVLKRELREPYWEGRSRRVS